MLDKPSPPPFKLIAGHPALDFINTLDWRLRDSGPEELLPTYADLLRFATQSELLSPKQASHLLKTTEPRTATRLLASALKLREAAADAFYSPLNGQPPNPAALATLALHLRAARSHQTLSCQTPHLAWTWNIASSGPELPLWLLALSLSDLLTSPSLAHVRACNSPDCGWLFLDTSRNGKRRWCDMSLCGNRMKARRFKAAQRNS